MAVHIASRFATFATLALAALGAHAATSQVSPAGYLVTHRAEVDAPASRIFQSLAQVDRWWNAEHTYSGKSENLRLDMRAGGCFCEQWAQSSVEHARVLYVARDKAIRLEGALGPLQEMAVTGILQFAISDAEGGRSQILFTYRVRGADAGLDRTAAIVDKVLGEQFARLVDHVSRGR